MDELKIWSAFEILRITEHFQEMKIQILTFLRFIALYRNRERNDEIETSDIINLLIDEINNKNYMVVYLRKATTGNREHLFYGYNLAEQIFYVITLKKGKFREITMT